MLLETAVQGFLFSVSTGSKATAENYKFQLGRFARYFGGKQLEEITTADLEKFIANLRSTPYQKTKSTQGVMSEATILAYHRSLRAFYAWASDPEKSRIEGISRPDNPLKRPKSVQTIVTPLTEAEVKKLLKACDYTKEAVVNNRKGFSMKRPSRYRDRAMVLLFLDTGIRVGEMCRLKVSDLDLSQGMITIHAFGTSIKSKPRHLYLGNAAKSALWRYLSTRTSSFPEDPVFQTMRGAELDRYAVKHLLDDLGERAGVPNVHPHRFRHTYAIQAIRNGMDIFTLQKNLGHSDLKMVKYYLDLAQTDQQAAQARTSPADRWHL